ncbi:MAG TPA: acyl carrier protein [Pseudonocardiaceae bacterium]|nr:acyl carrier protein [Pseudonocardiaceae bacterium]
MGEPLRTVTAATLDPAVEVDRFNPIISQLTAMPRSARRVALEELVITEFKATLIMPDDEELPLDQSYFEFGFTSLRITEIKQRLERLLGCEMSTTQLFNNPTVNQFMDYLAEVIFPDLLGGSSY